MRESVILSSFTTYVTKLIIHDGNLTLCKGEIFHYSRRFVDIKYTIRVSKWYVSTEPVWPMWWTRRDPWLPRRAWGGSRQNHFCTPSSEILLQLLNKLFILQRKRSSFERGKFGQYPKHTNQTRRAEGKLIHFYFHSL